MLWRWNLPELCISMRPFVWEKIWVPAFGRGGAWSKKLPIIVFLDPILTISLEFNKNCQISDPLPCIAYVVKVSNNFEQILWGYTQESKKPTYKVISTTSVSLTWQKNIQFHKLQLHN